MNKTKLLVLVGIIFLLAGCKLAVINVEGGEVESIVLTSSGSGTCVTGTVCIIDVSDPNFLALFIAKPDPGWDFEKWNSGDRFFCGGSSEQVCPLSFKGYEESEAVEEMVASDEAFYLMPIFKPHEFNPQEDVVRANGKEWIQPAIFANISWESINDVCPATTGICDGSLAGINMTGWTWASARSAR